MQTTNLQIDLTVMTSETGDMIDLLHGRAAGRLAEHPLSAFGTNTIVIIATLLRLHGRHQEIG